MNDWYKLCVHGEAKAHKYRAANVIGALTGQWNDRDCPGGSPVTAADLEGEKVWRCEVFEKTFDYERCRHVHPACGWRLLIPIPDP